MAGSEVSLLLAGEESWQGAFDNLSQRFAQLTAATIVEHLRQNGGHAGRTAQALRKLPADGPQAEQAEKVIPQQPAPAKADQRLESPIEKTVTPKQQEQEANGQSRTPPDSKLLFVAALQGDVQLLARLISEGADLNDRYTGRPNREKSDKIIDATPLHLVVTMGLTSVAEVLLRHGAAIEAKMQRALGAGKPPAEHYAEMTPLHLAAMEGHTNIVEMLIDHGADRNAKMLLREGQQERAITPIEIAREMANKGHTRASVITMLSAPI
jgi:hypothetical protein